MKIEKKFPRKDELLIDDDRNLIDVIIQNQKRKRFIHIRWIENRTKNKIQKKG